MAAQAAQNEQQIMQIVHSLYEGNTSYPSATDDDYLVRRDLGNKAILSWDMKKGTLWNELWIPSTSAPDGEFTISTNKTSYNAPSDFRFIAGFLRLVDAQGNVEIYKKRRPEQIDKLEGKTQKIFYVTGNARTGYKINFLPGISVSPTFPLATDIGKTIHYEYYHRPFMLAGVNDIPEMSNPDYIIHYILSYLYRQDDNFDASDREKQDAKEKMDEMQTVNMMSSWREDNGIEDGYYDDNDGYGFGN